MNENVYQTGRRIESVNTEPISWLLQHKRKKHNHNDKRIFIIYDFWAFPIAIFA